MVAAISPIDTTYVDQSTLITADWLNPINQLAVALMDAGVGDGKGLDVLPFDPSLSYIGPLKKRLTDVVTTAGFASLQAAVDAAVGKRLVVVGTWVITAAITLTSNTEVYLSPGAQVLTTTPDISHFVASSAIGVKVCGPGSIVRAGVTGTAAYVAGVKFTSCTDCSVEGVRFTGMQWAAVMLDGSSRCYVGGNYIGATTTPVQDSADINVYGNSSDNIIYKNWCYGNGSEHGVIVQDPYGYNQIPRRNLVFGNRGGTHTGYGVIFYVPGQMARFTADINGTVLNVTSFVGGGGTGNVAVGQQIYNASTNAFYGTIASPGTGTGGLGTYNLDTDSGVIAASTLVASDVSGSFNQAIANDFQGIQGSFATNRDSGAGYYVVGAGAGGSLIQGNTAKNCCTHTLTRSLAPAGIGINGIPAAAPKVRIYHNTVTGMTQGDGILVVSCPGGADIGPNTVIMPASNNGTGVGGATLLGAALRFEASSEVTFTGGSYTQNGTGACLVIYANGTGASNITGTGGSFTGNSSGATLVTTQIGGNLCSNVVLTGTRIQALGSGLAVSLPSLTVSNIQFSNCFVTGNTGAALTVVNVPNCRLGGGYWNSAGGTVLSTGGACPGSYVDPSTLLGGGTSTISNGATGFNIHWRGAAVPASGLWAQGDEWTTTTPAAGTSPGAFCTTSGSPGTWKTKPALAA